MTKTSDGDEIILTTGRRLALLKSSALDDWYTSYSPRNDNCNAEGNWKEWVALAEEILKLNEETLREPNIEVK